MPNLHSPRHGFFPRVKLRVRLVRAHTQAPGIIFSRKLGPLTNTLQLVKSSTNPKMSNKFKCNKIY